ncbi:MAG: dephospho-CoA kinase [Micropruina sp.]|uniref:dephospho-CoA kinase n=1 Tax=Micropruina sp. TaxID=2737536 RepID=UPI0039E5D0A0
MNDERADVLLVGLTGGIASGKTAVADRLAELGAVVIDADLLAREVVEPGTPGLDAIAARFGAGVLRSASGGPELDRAALGAIVFADPAARRDLEAIVHPAVRARAAELTRAAPSGSVVVQVIPLLVETGQQDAFDVVVVVDVDPEVQLTRLVARSGLTPGEAQARIDAQAGRGQRLAAADAVLDNNGTPAQLRVAVDALWTRLAAASRDDAGLRGTLAP